MIPLREQEALRAHFQHDLLNRVRIDYFMQKPSSIYVPGRQDCPLCEDVLTFVEELASLSERIALTVHDLSEAQPLAEELGVDKVPAIVLRGQANRPLRFFGAPLGNQFPGLVGTLLDAARGSVQLLPDTVKQLRRLKSDVRLQVLVTPACVHSPLLARTAMKLGLQSVRVKVAIVEVTEYPALIQRYNVRAVPLTIIDDSQAIPGAIDEPALMQEIMRVAEGKPVLAPMQTGPTTPLADTSAQTQASAGGLIIPR